MRDINTLSAYINKFTDKVIENVAKAQRETAQAIWEDVVQNAPSGTGEYISSIQISPTIKEGNAIKTEVFTDLKSTDGYVIGRMIEYGTGIYALQPHIGHTKTFKESGYRYWYVPVTSVGKPIGKLITINGQQFYVAKPQPSKPHFIPALQKNEATYLQNIDKAVKEAEK